VTGDTLREGEVAVPLPEQTQAGVYFIGTVHTPWHTRAECPKRGQADGPDCSIIVDPRWQTALEGIGKHARLQILYWMHLSRRDLVKQTPRGTGITSGTFAIRSPVRPNPIASSVVALLGVDGNVLRVRGMDCVDGTPVVDIKPYRPE
jgi:tRNA-Thr(GGU) m(6)t(6)A37 methyltransferase TsaA